MLPEKFSVLSAWRAIDTNILSSEKVMLSSEKALESVKSLWTKTLEAWEVQNMLWLSYSWMSSKV